MAEEHRSDSINESLRDPVTIGNPCRCKADFSYSVKFQQRYKNSHRIFRNRKKDEVRRSRIAQERV